MTKKFLKKIIAQTSEDLRIISALCSESSVKTSEIKFLKSNKVFLLTVERKSKEDQKINKVIKSIIKFDYVENSKSINIDQNENENILELLTIENFKKKDNLEIILLFSKNKAITLQTEVIEVTLENIEEIND